MKGKIPGDICEILKKVVNGNLEDYDVQVHDSNKKGDGFLGQIFFISLENRHSEEQLHLVVKQAFSEGAIREQNPIRAAFENEIHFYANMWPKFVKFQEEISPNIRFCQLAKCFETTCEENNEKLVFENLRYDGFFLHNKRETLSMDQYELIYKLYGRFHAISFAYKSRHPEEFFEMAGDLVDVWGKFNERESFHESIKLVHEQCLKLLQQGVEDSVIGVYTKYLTDGAKIFCETLKSGDNPILTHGDCWSNNMLFKYNDSGKLKDVRFLDFQLVRLGSPAGDLSYCLYSGGSKEVFDQLDHLLQIYYDSLSQNLRAYGCDPDELYPFSQLKRDWKMYCRMGMTLGLMIWRSKLTYDEGTIDFSDLSEGDGDLTKFFKTSYDEKTYEQRARDIIFHFYENDYL